MLAAISDEALISINTIELVGIIYLGIALSRLQARIAYIEGMLKARSSEASDDQK